jgi:hypothetical protein
VTVGDAVADIHVPGFPSCGWRELVDLATPDDCNVDHIDPGHAIRPTSRPETRRDVGHI